MNDGGERFVASIRRRLGRLAGRGVDAVDLTEEGAALAADLQWLALERSRRDETRAQARLAALLDDREGRLFTAALTDQMDRARSAARTADQIVHLMDVYELPRYLGRLERAQLRAFRRLGPRLPRLLVPLVRRRVRRETAGVVISAEEPALSRYLTARAAEGVRVNLNQLGETIVGEAEAERRVARTLEAIARPDVSCVSVKISSIGSQLELLAWEETLGVLAERLRTLLRGALAAPHRRPDGREEPKRVVLDMEAYDHQQLTLALLRHVLDEPEFLGAAAGVALQAYLPDAHPAQCELVAWARERAARGGAPVRVRLVKGANLAAERCASALRGWPQAPYHTKLEVDARYKHMLLFGSRPENAVAAPLGVASHNVFDIAFGLVVRALAGVEAHVGFEMLAGMAEPLRRAVQEIAGDVLVYSPAVSKREFHSAIAYLIRRLDENTSPENFLRVAFGLRPGSEAWALEERRFRSACRARDGGERPRREQDRRRPAVQPPLEAAFSNEPDTDFALVQNRTWIQAVAERWRCCETRDVPCQVAGELVFDAAGGWQEGRDPSQPERRLYRVALGDAALAERAVASAERAAHGWGALPIAERSRILGAVASSA
jgi:RHH-type proline utilization regulon transcriptional repressor/proline dehydrogenase/delta 1-pyrroline-5-carboxylate dehydrogenase